MKAPSSLNPGSYFSGLQKILRGVGQHFTKILRGGPVLGPVLLLCEAAQATIFIISTRAERAGLGAVAEGIRAQSNSASKISLSLCTNVIEIVVRYCDKSEPTII